MEASDAGARNLATLGAKFDEPRSTLVINVVAKAKLKHKTTETIRSTDFISMFL
jgi:hypothetical protein